MELRGQYHVLAALFPEGKKTTESIEWEVWWAREPVWTFRGVKSVLALSEPHHDSSIFQPGS